MRDHGRGERRRRHNSCRLGFRNKSRENSAERQIHAADNAGAGVFNLPRLLVLMDGCGI